MSVHHADPTVTLHHGDCLDVLRELPDASIDSVVTDPPYALSFMGKHWDAHENPAAFQAWCQLWAAECLRVLKPGGHMLAFGGTRTWHRLACAIEDAGFEVRDSIAWLYGSGFPKSLDVSKAIDKAAGAERSEVLGSREARHSSQGSYRYGDSKDNGGMFTRQTHLIEITAPATDDARAWQGWGTALKPAHEPIVVARKPLAGTVAANVLSHGTGALNVDGCRVAHASEADLRESANKNRHADFGSGPRENKVYGADLRARGEGGNYDGSRGRWPANVILDESQAEALDEMSGESPSNAHDRGRHAGVFRLDGFSTVEELRAAALAGGKTPYGRDARTTLARYEAGESTVRGHADSGGASRFFFIARKDSEPCPPIADAPTYPDAGMRFVNAAANAGTFTDIQDVTPATARFLYTPKADASERVRVNGTAHPTVKPLALMRWLVRLVTPPGGVVLEPFAGSGTTVEACILEGFRCIAIEREADYLPLIVQRINRRRDPVQAVKATGEDGGLFDLLDEETA